MLYKICHYFNVFAALRYNIKIVVIGNITVGGTGKTPLTKHIALMLMRNKVRVGIVMRGYKGHNKKATIVTKNSLPNNVGDEALIYANLDIPVAVGKNRINAINALLESYPDIQIVLSDDGLQHYRMHRDYEIIVLDQTRMFGNGYLLPNGPLRECTTRLNYANAIVLTSKEESKMPTICEARMFQQIITIEYFYNYHQQYTLSEFISYSHKLNIAAIAAIGNPDRFFNNLIDSGICLKTTIAFPDHYQYLENDIPYDYDIILVTEKDYVKLKQFNYNNIWVVMVGTKLMPDGETLITDIKNLIDK